MEAEPLSLWGLACSSVRDAPCVPGLFVRCLRPPVGWLPMHPSLASLAPLRQQCVQLHCPTHLGLCLLASLLLWTASGVHSLLHCWSLPCLLAPEHLPHLMQAIPPDPCTRTCWASQFWSVRCTRGRWAGPFALMRPESPCGLGPWMPSARTAMYMRTRCCCHSLTALRPCSR